MSITRVPAWAEFDHDGPYVPPVVAPVEYVDLYPVDLEPVARPRPVRRALIMAAVAAASVAGMIMVPGIASAAEPSARCKDGAVSYSATRSGTCSGHGGVAEWLAGAPAKGAPRSAPAAPAAPAAPTCGGWRLAEDLTWVPPGYYAA